MSMKHLLGLAAATLALWPTVAAAQVTARPPRAFRGLFGGGPPADPNRPRTLVTFEANATGGYDDNVSTGEGLVPLPGTLGTADGGNTGVFDATLRYFRGNSARSFSIDGRGSYSTSRQNTFSSSRTAGLDATYSTELGRRTTFSVGGGANYVTQFGIATPFASVTPTEFEPSSPSLFSVGDRPSLNASARANATRQLGRRDRMVLGYDYTTQQFQEGDGDNSRSQAATIDYARQLSRWMSMTASYGYTKTLYDYGDGDAGRPGDNQRVSGGFSYLRRLSPRRTMTISGSAGAQQISAVTGTTTLTDYQVWTPWAQASTSLDLAGSWTLTGSFNRATSFFPGLVSETYVTNSGIVAVGGLLARRVDLTFSGGLASGSVPQVTNVPSTFTTATGSAQLRIALSRALAFVAGYNQYWYRFSETDLPAGFPPRFDRKTVRVGLSLFLPLYGTTSR